MRDGSLPYKVIEDAFFDFSKAVENSPEELREWRSQMKPMEVPLVEDDDLDGALDEDSSNDFFLDVPDVSENNSTPNVPHDPRPARKRNRRDIGAESSENCETDHRAGERNVVRGPRYLRNGKEVPYTRSRSAFTFGDYLDDYGCYQFMHAIHASSVKVTVGKALKSDFKTEWIKAIVAEITQLIAGKTLVKVDKSITKGHKVIHSTMQLKAKMHQNNILDKYKARLCACGDELFGLIQETFAPTISALAYATVHQIAVIDRMHKCTVDVVGAYLTQPYPDTAQPLYLMLPANVANVCGLDPDQCYQIKRYLYGLPDAGRAYYLAYSKHLQDKGYKRTVSDPCLFVKINGSSRTYVWSHVDDTFCCSNMKEELIKFQNAV
jgi:hypothetical protein